ncbi:circularly permuted type 2 ATP-grasp protein [Sphingomonas sp. ID1715]|uniref:circularly permuted type 2 ATP-grasp protein n=1 Tax=Sphingomonas sp. ID1715 TaxID=1656898 RepID=UPI0014892BE3|nr:circularly permuted type 2 ATP-grasp protein [Sphingomonas sp. ID1715]NNM76895.1 circularly permuted type 2 ATP-grasp protein [Sphingomonas sp. ID1715]
MRLGPAIFDEMTGGGADLRAPYALVDHWLTEATPEYLQTRRAQAELFFRRIGITFAVYGDSDADERLIPFDIVPRILARAEWSKLEAGLIQRVTALNAFLRDIYGAQEVVRAGVIPADLILRNPQFCLPAIGLQPAHGVYTHIAGIDIVRTGPDQFYVLEDNVRTPSGVSYMLENREVMLRLMPELIDRHRVAPVEDYPEMLLATLRSVAPPRCKGDPTVAVLTPGFLNSAYYEHSFLADKLGVELVEGSDLQVRDDVLYMRTTEGPRRVDVLYRRVDDAYLDPLVFRPDSVLGSAGMIAAHAAGNLTIANAIGTGIADDKAIYSYMPEIVRFYTGEAPLIDNVPTWRCREPDALAYVLDNLAELVVKEVDGSGGYGMLVGPHATRSELESFAAKLRADPDKFIAQPTLALSTCPTLSDSGIVPRHVDLRPFILTGAQGTRIVPGGLTRVALKQGSLVVNSSQGGGTKDTWVLDD